MQETQAALDQPGAAASKVGGAVVATASKLRAPGAASASAPSSSSDPQMRATAAVFKAAQAHWLSACLHVMLELKVADVLVQHAAAAPSPHAAAPAQAPAGRAATATGSSNNAGMHVDELARACGASPGHLYKVLRVLAQWELLEELPGKPRVFSPNVATRELVQDTETPSLGHMAHHLVNVPKWQAWQMLPEAVRQGKTAFELAHGMDVYQYGELPEHAAFGEEFCKSMSYFTRHSLAGGATSLEDAFDWSRCRAIMDVGGGRGELLSSVLSWAPPTCKGVLLDVQMVINSIDIPGMFEAKGVSDAAGRLTLVVGDVRKPFPPAAQQAQVDALLMKHFLSAFSDEDAVAIVQHCKQAMAPTGAILLLQTLVPEPGDRGHNYCGDGVAPGLFSIEILAMCRGGAWRTLAEWKAIFSKAGMDLASNTAVGCNMSLMVWRPWPVLG